MTMMNNIIRYLLHHNKPKGCSRIWKRISNWQWILNAGFLAGGGTLHADCEVVVLKDGSRQASICGADWNPTSQDVTFESLINIRPHQNNRSLEILDPEIRKQVAQITYELLGER